MMPRIQAEEAIQAANVIEVGTGATTHPRKISDEWERRARGLAAPSGPAQPAALNEYQKPVRRVAARKG